MRISLLEALPAGAENPHNFCFRKTAADHFGHMTMGAVLLENRENASKMVVNIVVKAPCRTTLWMRYFYVKAKEAEIQK